MSFRGCKRRQAPSSTVTKPKTVHKVHINSLPDICLQAIFKNQPLTQQLCNLAVCPKWEMVQRNEFRSRKSLIIDFGGNSVDKFETTRIQYSEHLDEETQKKLNYDSLELIRFNSLIVKDNFYSTHSYIFDFGQLADYFSNVTTCRIASDQPRYRFQSSTLVAKNDINNETIFEIIKLLTSPWQSKLTTFELYISLFSCPWINMVESKSVLRPMFSAINGLTSLRHLKLIFDSDIFTIKTYDVCDEGVNYTEGHVNMSLPILSQLESFCFASGDSVKCIIQTLIRDATGNEKLKISFSNRFTTFRLPNDPKGLPLQLTQKFTQLYLYKNVDFMLLPKCPNLTSLNIEDSLYFSPANINILSELKSLLVLCLKVNDSKDISSVQYTRLGSVKILHLRTPSDSQLSSHQDMAKYHIPWIFPGLQVLTIYYCNTRCDTCGYIYSVDEFGWGTEPDSELIKKCIRSFACPLNEGLPNLKYGHVIVKNSGGNSQSLWTFAELSFEYTQNKLISNHLN